MYPLALGVGGISDLLAAYKIWKMCRDSADVIKVGSVGFELIKGKMILEQGQH
jgi:hypothetical protein